MIEIGQNYRPSGRFDGARMKSLIAGGLLKIGLLAAAATGLELAVRAIAESYIRPFFLLFILVILGFTAVCHVIFGIEKAHVRGRRVGIATSVALMAFGILAYETLRLGILLALAPAEVRTRIEGDPFLEPRRKQVLLSRLAQDPRATVEQYRRERTGHDGVIGAFLLSLRPINHGPRPPEFRGPAPDWPVYAAIAFAVLLFGITLALNAEKMLSHFDGPPYCEGCGRWCRHRASLDQVALRALERVEAALRDDDSAAVARLARRARTGGDEPIRVSLLECPGCGLAFAEVFQTVKYHEENGGVRYAEVRRLGPVRVSPAMAKILGG